MDTVWIVGQFRAEETSGVVWDFQGVFERRDDAIAACCEMTLQHPDAWYFVGPATLNVMLPHEVVEWPGCFYPRAAGQDE